MRRAFALARRGPTDDENPQVGCVLLAPDGTVVAEGWHLGAGTPHAEVAALRQLPNEWIDREPELTAVVTLEPCNHMGRTGPCAVALAERGIGSVVFSVSDPGADSAGGAETLRAKGISVQGGVLEAEGRLLLAPWFARHAQAHTHAHPAQERPGAQPADTDRPRPHITVKWAQTLDGRAAAADGSSQWITGPIARADVHARRAEADAILVGTGTLIDDNPALTARDEQGDLLVPAADQPLPVVLGRRAIPRGARVLRHPALDTHGLKAPIHFDGNDLPVHLEELYQRGVRRLFVEGGPTVASAFLAQNLADEVLVYIAPSLLGGPRLAIGELGIESIAGIQRLHDVRVTQLGDDLLIRAVTDTGANTSAHKNTSTNPGPTASPPVISMHTTGEES